MLYFIHRDEFPVANGLQDLLQGDIVAVTDVSFFFGLMLVWLANQGFRVVFLYNKTPDTTHVSSMEGCRTNPGNIGFIGLAEDLFNDAFAKLFPVVIDQVTF